MFDMSRQSGLVRGVGGFMHCRLTVLIGTILLFSVAGQPVRAQIATIEISADSFSERDRRRLSFGDVDPPSIQVSLPSEVAGVTVNAAQQEGGFPDLFVNGITSQDRIICLTLSSADGFYEARGVAPLQAAARRYGVAKLVFPTRVERFTSAYSNEVAAFVRSSRDPEGCDSNSPVLSTSWGSPTGNSDGEISLLVGGQGRRDRPDVRYADQDTATLCAPLATRGRSRAGYRWVCTPNASTCLPEREVVIAWRRGARSQPGFRFNLRRTCF